MVILCFVFLFVKINKYRVIVFDGKIVLKIVFIFKNLLSNLLLNSVICIFLVYELDYVVFYNDFVSELFCLYIG